MEAIERRAGWHLGVRRSGSPAVSQVRVDIEEVPPDTLSGSPALPDRGEM